MFVKALVAVGIVTFFVEAARQFAVNYGHIAASSSLNQLIDIATTFAPAVLLVAAVVADSIKKHRANARRSWRDAY